VRNPQLHPGEAIRRSARSQPRKSKLFSLLATFFAPFFCTHLEYLSIDATYDEESGGMKEKLRRSRRFGLFLAAAATALIAAAPAGALAAAEESKDSSAPGGAAAESPGGQTESHSESAPPAEAAPPSTGWVPQSESTETSSDGATGARRGSSLGSGGGSNAKSTGEESPQTSGSSGYDEQPTSSSGYYEQPRSSTPPATAEPASKPQVSSGGGSTEPSAPKAPTGNRVSMAVGAAAAVARSESLPVADTGDLAAAAIAPLANPHDQTAPGIGTLKMLLLIVCGFILVYSGGRLLLGPVEPGMPAFLRAGVRRLR
jgi:hypothetical protein